MIKVSSQLFPPALVKTQVECRKLNENKLEIRTTRRAVLHDCFAPPRNEEHIYAEIFISDTV
jgi:hypothetical protein